MENSVCIWCPLAWTDCIIWLNSCPPEELTGPPPPLKLAPPGPGLGGKGTCVWNGSIAAFAADDVNDGGAAKGSAADGAGWNIGLDRF